jgi:hypothetical protein
MNVFLAAPRDLEAPLRLTRSQLTQKIGARGHYPRSPGVLIPRPLLEICGEGDGPRAGEAAPTSSSRPPGERRKQLGRDVVQTVARALRHFPAEILGLELPHPSAVLRWLPIEDRTRNALDRLLPLIEKEPRWTVARYLEIPKFGARCLVDLLAAREEVDGPPWPPRSSVPAGHTYGGYAPSTRY